MFLSPPNFVWGIRVKTHRRGSRSGHELAANPRAWHASPPTTRSEGEHHEHERPQEATRAMIGSVVVATFVAVITFFIIRRRRRSGGK